MKGRLLASTIWQDLIANEMTPEQAADNWKLPLPAIAEIICYCESYHDLIGLEANEERYQLETKGVLIEPTITPDNQQNHS